MRADSRPAQPDFPWRTVIRMEMETWMPERLPSRFQPRSRRPIASSPARVWRPLAAGVAVLMFVGVAYARLAAPAGVTTAVEFVTNTAARLAPAPAATPSPAAPDQPARPDTAAPGQQSVAPAPAPTPGARRTPAPSLTAATPAPSAAATPSPEPSSLLQQVLPSQPTPAQSPESSSSPSRLCLPLKLICL